MHELLTERETAAIVRRAPITLRKWRKDKRGPKFILLAGRVYYPRRDLEAWIRSQPTGGGYIKEGEVTL